MGTVTLARKRLGKGFLLSLLNKLSWVPGQAQHGPLHQAGGVKPRKRVYNAHTG
jgi:hypothetical protein